MTLENKQLASFVSFQWSEIARIPSTWVFTETWQILPSGVILVYHEDIFVYKLAHLRKLPSLQQYIHGRRKDHARHPSRSTLRTATHWAWLGRDPYAWWDHYLLHHSPGDAQQRGSKSEAFHNVCPLFTRLSMLLLFMFLIFNTLLYSSSSFVEVFHWLGHLWILNRWTDAQGWNHHLATLNSFQPLSFQPSEKCGCIWTQ